MDKEKWKKNMSDVVQKVGEVSKESVSKLKSISKESKEKTNAESDFLNNSFEFTSKFNKKIFLSIKDEFLKLNKKEKKYIYISYGLCIGIILLFIIISAIAFNIPYEDGYNILEEYNIDYHNETDFENALNNDEDVLGKIVKFTVNDYKPNSALGVNCWSGEHLNFISSEEINVKKGNIVTGKISKEPTKILGSWRIEYIVIAIEEKEVNSNLNINTNENSDLNNNKSTLSEDVISDETNNVVTPNDDIINNNDNNSVTNDANTNTTTDKNDTNSTTNTNNDKKEEIKYNFYTTNSDKDAKAGNKGIFSYVDKGINYDIYWIIDFDGGYVYNFTEGNGDESCSKVKIKSGNLNDGVELSYKKSSNAWAKYIHFKYSNQPHQLVVVDNDYFKYEYKTVSLELALELKSKKNIYIE